MSAPDVEYAAGHARLESLLRSIDRPGDFCAHGRLLAPMPRLEVEGIGMVSFPVPETQARVRPTARGRRPWWTPRAAPGDEFGLVQPDDGFGQSLPPA